ncbi:mycofactocin precursor [Mycobacterium adipatum]|uniref:Mycofactocin n=1 Tax=Mycobacterium adipatum TaxID=1682113 RepID=A0A172UT05_9MYCO|nr:mycofactocin precursor [Mycobacterium adipatum]
MPYCCDPGHKSSNPGDLITARKVPSMDKNQQVDNDTELVTESLVEEVSIDGMCGVY